MDKRFPSPVVIILLISALFAYIGLGYFTIRTHFSQLIALYGGLFILYFLGLSFIRSNHEIKWGIAGSWVFRIALIGVIPNLSDDFYRFIWDGHLWVNGVNPYMYLPKDIINNPDIQVGALDKELYQNLNSPQYYSVYPPVGQYLFGWSVLFFKENWLLNVIMMRLPILAADIGSIKLIEKLLVHLKLSKKRVLWYALNPLVIVELTGNLHLEAFMIFFFLLSVYWFICTKWVSAVFPYILAIGAKLLPFLFLPALLKRLGLKRSGVVILLLFTGTAMLFLPFGITPTTFSHLFDSIQLYFQKFEFNASIYYLLRWLGYQITGYNIIHIAGKILALCSLTIVLGIAYTEKRSSWEHFFKTCLLSLTVYLFLATTVHPWYLTPLLALCCFTDYKYPYIWAALIPFTYITYQTLPYQENFWIVGVEYGLVYGLFITELKQSSTLHKLKPFFYD